MNDAYTEEENAEIWKYRSDVYQGILKEQFQMTYFGKIDFASTENMDIGERKVLYDILVEQKKEEQKQQEQAIKEAKAKKGSNGWRRKR